MTLYNKDSLRIFNISNPDSAFKVSTSYTGDGAQYVTVSGNYAYVVNMIADNLAIVNISNPAAPFVTGTVSTGNSPRCVAVSGNYAYVTNYLSNNMQVINITNPSAPAVVGSYNITTSPLAIAISGNYAYVTGNSQMLVAVNISNPLAPVIANSVNLNHNGTSVVVSGNFAYAAGGNGLTVVDISNPSTPVIMGATGTDGAGSSNAVSGNFAYQVNASSNTMQVFDISNPSTPFSTGGSVSTDAYPTGIAVSGQYAYVVNLTTGTLQIFSLNCQANYNISYNSGTNTISTLPELWEATSSSNIAATAYGNVGIGTTAPQAKLHLAVTGVGAVFSTALLAQNNTGYQNALRVRLKDGNVDIGADYMGSANNTDLSFSTNASSGPGALTEQMRIRVDGNVGIGTNSPSSKLTVSGGIQCDQTNSNDGNTSNALKFGDDATGEAIASKRTAGGNQYGLDFYTSSTNRLAITNNGKIGIGVNQPTYDLDIYKTGATVNERVYANNPTGIGRLMVGAFNGGEINLLGNASGATVLGIPTGNSGIAVTYGNMCFATGTGGSATERMRITSAGNFGMGTTNPTQAKLVVNGNQSYSLGNYGYLNSNAITSTNGTGNSNSYSIYASDRVAATEFNAYSDARIKHITGITDNADDLNTLMQLQITNYRFIDTISKGNNHYKKVIAQEVEKVYPNAVSRLTDVVPDIYELADIKNGRIELANTLKPGDRVKLITESKSDIFEVTAAEPTSFTVNMEGDGKVFVFGREVKDFRAVDYEALTTLNISATQALVKMVNELERKNEGMEQKFASLSSDVEMLKGMLNLRAKAEK